jgi:hypothetical protein
MTVEEIRERVSMFDLARDYGLKVDRHGMCSCPFHGTDKHPSMKIYKDGYKCFACGSVGDVFKFVQNIENCSFKEAFLKLGGTYQRESNSAAEAVRRAQMEAKRAERARAQKTEAEFKQELVRAITFCQCIKEAYEPFSDEWCLAMNHIEHLQDSFERYLNGEEVNKEDVSRECRKLRRDYASLRRALPGAVQDRQ